MYKQSPEQDDLDLVGHVPIELSRILVCFLAASESNFLNVQVCGNENASGSLSFLDAIKLEYAVKKLQAC